MTLHECSTASRKSNYNALVGIYARGAQCVRVSQKIYACKRENVKMYSSLKVSIACSESLSRQGRSTMNSKLQYLQYEMGRTPLRTIFANAVVCKYQKHKFAKQRGKLCDSLNVV